MPTFLKYALIVATLLALVPPAVIARLQVMHSDKPRVHLVQDMDNQPKFRAQARNPLFADTRAMRPIVPGTIARGELFEDDHLHRGIVEAQWATRFPPSLAVDMPFMQRGQERFNIYCTPCHGYAGYGNGLVNQRAMQLLNIGANGTTWVQAKSLHEDAIRAQPPGQIFNTITNGIRTMSGYASQIPVEDRWAIAAYVKALQRSQTPQHADAD
jgi:mono/diheme cytochrome c family protein